MTCRKKTAEKPPDAILFASVRSFTFRPMAPMDILRETGGAFTAPELARLILERMEREPSERAIAMLPKTTHSSFSRQKIRSSFMIAQPLGRGSGAYWCCQVDKPQRQQALSVFKGRIGIMTASAPTSDFVACPPRGFLGQKYQSTASRTISVLCLCRTQKRNLSASPVKGPSCTKKITAWRCVS